MGAYAETIVGLTAAIDQRLIELGLTDQDQIDAADKAAQATDQPAASGSGQAQPAASQPGSDGQPTQQPATGVQAPLAG